MYSKLLYSLKPFYKKIKIRLKKSSRRYRKKVLILKRKKLKIKYKHIYKQSVIGSKRLCKSVGMLKRYRINKKGAKKNIERTEQKKLFFAVRGIWFGINF